MTIGKKNLTHHHHQPINTKKQSNTNTNTNTNNNNLMKMIHHYESELNCLLTECASIDVVLKSLQSFFFVQPMTTEEQLDKVNEELTIAHDELLSQVRQLYRNVIKLDKSIQSLPSHPSKNIPTLSQHNNIKKTKDKKWNNRNHHHTKITKNNINKRHLAFSSSFALSSSITSNSIK
ncbi:hypothetical protein BJ944DRAFT_239972 [Cunninghamella echinulata]|nr:hypothetical protein BJ944DRAFT_239972 [Cunninghamella echinulata]